MMRRPRKETHTIIALTILLASTTLLWADPTPLDNGDFSEFISYNSSEITENWVATVQAPGAQDERVFSTNPPEAVIFFLPEDAPDGSTLTLAQEVTLTPGLLYRLGFQFNAKSDASESDFFKVFATSLDFGLVEKVVEHNEMKPMDAFEKYDYLDFTAGVQPVQLGFQLVRVGDNGVEPELRVDYAELSIVPIPGAALLGSIGLGYDGLRLRRRVGAVP